MRTQGLKNSFRLDTRKVIQNLKSFDVAVIFVLGCGFMHMIREVVEEAIATGYLTVAAEEKLRRLLKVKYDMEDLNAFMLLQEAAMTGKVKQESRELKETLT